MDILEEFYAPTRNKQVVIWDTIVFLIDIYLGGMDYENY